MKFFSWISQKVGKSLKLIIGSALLIILVVTGVFLANKQNKQNKNSEPEIAQIFEPSIGTPLPPDINPEITPNESTPETNSANENVTGAVEGATTFIAPQTGIDPSQPIRYQSSEFGFYVVLPAKTVIKERGSQIDFFTPAGKLFGTVSQTPSNISIEEIKNQLNLSLNVTELQSTQYQNFPALSFRKDHLLGWAVLSNNNTLYILGSPDFVNQLSI